MVNYIVRDTDCNEFDYLSVDINIASYTFGANCPAGYELENTGNGVRFRSGNRELKLDYSELSALILMSEVLIKNLSNRTLYKEIDNDSI